MNDELKACPWCGEKPLVDDPDPGKSGWYVGCPRDACAAQPFVQMNFSETRAEAITAWNTRAALAQPPGEGEVADKWAALRQANIDRQLVWANGVDPGLMFHAVEFAGEAGELLNVVKKLERERCGWRGSRATLADLADELADVIICADKLAGSQGIDLWAAVVAKFNATSEKVGLPQRLSCNPSASHENADALSRLTAKDPQ